MKNISPLMMMGLVAGMMPTERVVRYRPALDDAATADDTGCARWGKLCRLPSCKNRTQHNGGYCCADHCREHRAILRAGSKEADKNRPDGTGMDAEQTSRLITGSEKGLR